MTFTGLARGFQPRVNYVLIAVILDLFPVQMLLFSREDRMLNMYAFALNFFSISRQITRLHICTVNTCDNSKEKQRNLEGNHKRENLPPAVKIVR